MRTTIVTAILLVVAASAAATPTASAHPCTSHHVDGCGPCEEDGREHRHVENGEFRCESSGDTLTFVWYTVKELIPGAVALPDELDRLLDALVTEGSA